MTRWRHIECGKFVEECQHSTRTSYWLCRFCMKTVGREKVEEVDE